MLLCCIFFFFFFQAEDGIRDDLVTGVHTCALPISPGWSGRLAARAYSPSSWLAAVIAAVSRAQVMTGLPALVPVRTARRSLTGPGRICAAPASTRLRVLQGRPPSPVPTRGTAASALARALSRRAGS